jgi:hypothetical protein
MSSAVPQMVALYSFFFFFFFFFLLLDLTVVNAYILHGHMSVGLLEEPMKHLYFLPSIAFTLMDHNFLARKKTTSWAPNPNLHQI